MIIDIISNVSITDVNYNKYYIKLHAIDYEIRLSYTEDVKSTFYVECENMYEIKTGWFVYVALPDTEEYLGQIISIDYNNKIITTKPWYCNISTYYAARTYLSRNIGIGEAHHPYPYYRGSANTVLRMIHPICDNPLTTDVRIPYSSNNNTFSYQNGYADYVEKWTVVDFHYVQNFDGRGLTYIDAHYKIDDNDEIITKFFEQDYGEDEYFKIDLNDVPTMIWMWNGSSFSVGAFMNQDGTISNTEIPSTFKYPAVQFHYTNSSVAPTNDAAKALLKGYYGEEGYTGEKYVPVTNTNYKIGYKIQSINYFQRKAKIKQIVYTPGITKKIIFGGFVDSSLVNRNLERQRAKTF